MTQPGNPFQPLPDWAEGVKPAWTRILPKYSVGKPTVGSGIEANIDPQEASNLRARAQVPQSNQPPGVPEQPPVPATEDSSRNLDNQAMTERNDVDSIYGLLKGQAGPGTEVQPEGYDYLPFTKKAWDRADQAGPAAANSVLQGAEAEASKSKALEQWYKNEQARQSEAQAAYAAQRQERADIYDQQRQKLIQATQKWSNNIADRGSYWRNPGAILGAIGAAFMTLGTKDPRIGIDLIQSQINADHQAKVDAANTEIGGLQNNLNTYRQIAGDANQGDLLQLAESNRIAAIEVMRLGQQFEGPIAKAKAEQIANDLLERHAILMGTLNAKFNYNQAQVRPKPIMDAIRQGGRNNPGEGWQPAGQPDYYTTGPGKKPAALPVNKAIQSLGGKPTASTSPTSAVKPGNGEDSGVKNVLADSVRREAMAELGSNFTPDQYNKKVIQIQKDDEKAITAAMSGVKAEDFANAKGWQDFNNDLAQIRVAAKLVGKSENDIIQTEANQWLPGGLARFKDALAQRYGGRDTPEAKQAMAALDSAIRFKQNLNNRIVEYKRQAAGMRAMNGAHPIEGLEQVITPGDTYEKIANWAEQQSRQANASLGPQWASLNSRQKYLASKRFGKESPRLDTAGVPGR